jgi:hypothetical protein
MAVARVKLGFAPGLEIEFVDRDKAIRQVYEFAEESTRLPVVIFGPEGCGKTSWLLQAVEILKEMGYSVIYFNPLRRRFEAEVGIDSVRQVILDRLRQASTEHEFARLVWLALDIAVAALKHGRRRLAIVVDDAFQYLSPREAAAIVKGLLELIEHPVERYERIVAIVATSEGLSRFEIGRHLWAWIMPMWNMSREGFEKLYERIPDPKPSFEEVWRLTGGNPRVLSMLYMAGWNVDAVVEELARSKAVTIDFVRRWRQYLEDVVEDPDALMERDVPEELKQSLIERNLIVYDLFSRKPDLWIDEPPPEKDPEIGVGKYVAWQSPLHREAVRKALEQ